MSSIAADRRANEVLELALRRRAFPLALPEHHAAPLSGSAGWISNRLVALALMKPCRASETSSSLSAARRASASAMSEVALLRDHPSLALKHTIRTG